MLRDIRSRWEDTLPGVATYIDEINRASDALQKLEDRQALVADAFEPVVEIADELAGQITQLQGTLQLNDMVDLGINLVAAFEAWKKEIDAGRTGTQQLIALQKLLTEASATGIGGISELINSINDGLLPALRNTTAEVKRIKEAFDEMSPPPFLSGIGPAPIGMGLSARDAEAGRVLGGTAADVIKREEGFRTGAYCDSNAFAHRLRFRHLRRRNGQDPEGDQETVVTLEQANQASRPSSILEFQQTIQTQIGPDMWRSFTENQQAALTSIAYNYGRLPASIVKAIQQGDQGQVAKAIAALSANPERRKREAELFGGGMFSSTAAKAQFRRMAGPEQAARSRLGVRERHARRFDAEDQRADGRDREAEIHPGGSRRGARAGAHDHACIDCADRGGSGRNGQPRPAGGRCQGQAGCIHEKPAGAGAGRAADRSSRRSRPSPA